ncbi:unnamed protein product, partial [Effrenium voratum]
LFFTDLEYFETLQGIGMRHSRLTACQKVRLEDITERTAQSTAQPSSMPEASEPVRPLQDKARHVQQVDLYIADQLGVSPTAVRDELKKMRREGEVIARFGARAVRVYVRPSPRQIMTLVVS